MQHVCQASFSMEGTCHHKQHIDLAQAYKQLSATCISASNDHTESCTYTPSQCITDLLSADHWPYYPHSLPVDDKHMKQGSKCRWTQQPSMAVAAHVTALKGDLP